MVAVECGLNECQYCYVLRPNRSLTWRQNLLFLGGLSGMTPVSYTHLDVYKRQVLTLIQATFHCDHDLKAPIF